MSTIEKDGYFIQLDELTMSRIKRQAERTYGGVRGAIQSYIRAATLAKVQEDEAKEPS